MPSWAAELAFIKNPRPSQEETEKFFCRRNFRQVIPVDLFALAAQTR